MARIRPPYYFTAYGLAVKHGFQGTEQEWLESLNGDKVQLRYLNGILQWKWVTGSDDQWQDLIDLSQVQGWSNQAQQYAQDASDYCQGAEEAAQEVQEATEELYQKAEALTKSVSTRMVVAFENGSIDTGDGADANGTDYANRIRSGYFPNLSGTIGVTAPATVKSRLVFYNGDLSFHSSAVGFTAGSYQVSKDAAFARLIVGYEDDSEVSDVDALANMVAVYMPVEVPETTQALTVTITGNNADGYTADNDVYDIISADAKGQECVCHWGTVKLPLVRLENEVAYFAAVVDGIEYRVEIGSDSVVAVCEKLGGDVFDITVAGNDTDGYSADKTYEEIRAAEAEGRILRCLYGTKVLSLVYSSEIYVTFGCVVGDVSHRVVIDEYRVNVTQQELGGDSGSGVYVGTEEPTDPNVNVWINPEGDDDEPESGSSYVLPVATSETLGGVMPVAKTEEMTVPVGVDAAGGLWVNASGGTQDGSGSSGGATETMLVDFTLEEDVSQVDIPLDDAAVAALNSAREIFFELSLTMPAADDGTETGTLTFGIAASWGMNLTLMQGAKCLPTNAVAWADGCNAVGVVTLSKISRICTGMCAFRVNNTTAVSSMVGTTYNNIAGGQTLRAVGSIPIGAGSRIRLYVR